MPLFRILHISDIHIGDTYRLSGDIPYKIVSDIDQSGLSPIHAVAITGDIFNGPSGDSEELIDEAVEFFETLLTQINTFQENGVISKQDFIFVPGNHDLIRTGEKDKQWVKYKSFLSKFYNGIPKHYNADDFSVYKVYENAKIAFLGFNSCRVEKKTIISKDFIKTFENIIDSDMLKKNNIDKNVLLDILNQKSKAEYKDYGEISLQQLSSMRRNISKDNDFNVIALFHHHFYLFPEILKEVGDVSVIRNHAEVTQFLKYMNVKTILHGHKHYDIERPFITDDYYKNSDSIINVFSAGSLGSARKDIHTFNVLDFYDKNSAVKLKQIKFTYTGELLAVSKNQIPPENSASNIVKLLDILNSIAPDKHNLYIEYSEKLFTIRQERAEIIKWVSDALTGFNETYEQLNENALNILFILYAINYRCIMYNYQFGTSKNHYDESVQILKEFFSKNLSTELPQVTEEEFYQLFSNKELSKVSTRCDTLLTQCNNVTSKKYLAFTMLGVFFSDFYLILTKYADNFKETIKHKVNIKIEESKFHENVPASRIVIRSNTDRRSVFIELRCNEATAHKMAVLFVKEFDLLISKFEDYFKLLGLKIYYILPEIEKNDKQDSLDNYNFEAYIPTLLPLLTGDNIYPSKEVFARELIQNSIDAIAVRSAKDPSIFSKDITIKLGYDDNQRRYFKIIDNGTGMDRYKIERYFTSIGRSFYSGEDYEDLHIPYKPISSFGIGFLSSFMVCKEIDVETKYYTDKCENLKLHIPNYDGCFFVEKTKELKVGTELKLYLDTELDSDKIVNYIKANMRDIKYNINIEKENRNRKLTKERVISHEIRRNSSYQTPLFFIPLTEDYEILDIDYSQEVMNDVFIEKYEYGILISHIKPKRKNKKSVHLLNSGILVSDTSIFSLFQLEEKHKPDKADRYTDIFFNFPSNWIQLDVSREKITSFSKRIDEKYTKNQSDSLSAEIAKKLYKQIKNCMESSKTNNCLKSEILVQIMQEIIEFSMSLCEKNPQADIYQNLKKLQYCVGIIFTKKSVKLNVSHEKDRPNPIIYSGEDAKAQKESFIKENSEVNETIYRQMGLVDSSIHGHIYIDSKIQNPLISQSKYKNKYLNNNLFDFYHLAQSAFDNSKETILLSIILFLLQNPHEEYGDLQYLLHTTKETCFKYFTISEVANGTAYIEMSYEEILAKIKLLPAKNRRLIYNS